MRRFPSSWNATLAKLGLRLKRRSSKQHLRNRVHGYGRRNTLEQLESRELLASTPWAGSDLVIGDFDGDGNLDRLGSMAASTSSGEVWTIDTKNSSTANTIESWQVTRSVGTAGTLPESTLSGNSIVGDFNGDSRDDILARSGSGAWYVIESRASSLPGTFQGAFNIKSWGSALSAADGWGQTVVGDFNGDGRDDIAAFDDRNAANKQWIVRTSTGAGFDTQFAWAELQSVSPTAGSLVAADFNGDGRDDIAFRRSGPTAWAIAISDGSRFNVDTNSLTSTWSTGRVGDFDGDNADEILGWNTTLAQWETFNYSDGTGMSLDTAWGSALGSIASTQNVHVGDANRDGRDDLVIFDTGANKWKAALSQKATDGTNTFVYTAADVDGTNDWFKNWDWGPGSTPYKFLNVDAPYQAFLNVFSDVYNTIELELYPGLMKGIEATAQTKAGNDWDQAALLVDRLEAAGFDADIAFGTVTVKAQQAALWIGTTPVGTALSVGAAAYNVIRGTVDANATLLADGSVRFKHAWVRAVVPTLSGFQIVDVDPSWKFKDRQNGEIVDLTPVTTNYTPVVGRDQRGTFDEFGYLANAAVNQLPIEWYEDQVSQYLAATGKNRSMADVPYDGPIIQKQFDTFPIGWGSDVVVENPIAVESFDNFVQIKDSVTLSERLTHRATISVNRYAASVGTDFDLDIPADFVPASAEKLDLNSAINWYPLAAGGNHSIQSGPVYNINGTRFIAIPIPSGGYTITSKTRIRFTFNGTFSGGVDPDIRYTLGLDNGGPGFAHPIFDGSAGEKYDTFDNHPLGQVYYEKGSGTKVLDIPVASFLGYTSATTMEYVVFGLWDKDGNQVPSSAAQAIISNIALYENDNTTIVGDSIVWQVDSSTAAIDLPTPYTVTPATRLEFEFASNSDGQLHAIGWDNDFDGTNDAAEPDKRYRLKGTILPNGYSVTSQGAPTSDGYIPYSIAIGSYLSGGNTATMERLLFVTGAGANANAESVFRNVRLRDAATAWDVHLSKSLVVAEHSLNSIAVDYVKHENSAATPGDDTYAARLTMKSPNGTTTTINANAGKVFNVDDEVKIHIDHLGPTDFQLSNPGIKTYTRKPGQIHAIGLDANQYSYQRIVSLQAGLNGALADGASIADLDELLSYVAAKYWYESNGNHRTIDGLLRTIGGEQWVGSGIITTDLYLLTDSIPGLNGGTPVYTAEDLKHLQFPILPYNLGVDLPNLNHVSFDIGNGFINDEAFQLVGYDGSALENAILEEVVNSESVSTIRGLRNAYDSVSEKVWVYESVWENGERKIYQRGSISNVPSLTTYNPTGGTGQSSVQLINTLTSASTPHSPILADSVAAILENRHGKYAGIGSQVSIRVLVPVRKSVVGNWSGSVYVAEYATATGSVGSYIIAPDGGTPTSGGYSGNVRKAANVVLPPATFVNQTYAGDPVNVANGNMFRDEVDFTFANPVIPLDFARHYDSQNKLDVGFGVGWVHGFTGFIYEEDDPANSGDKDYIWLRGSGERHTFEGVDFKLPNTLFGDIVITGTGANQKLTFQDRSGTHFVLEKLATPFLDPLTQKMVYGRLVAIKDASGHQGVNITYESANSIRVAKVESISSPSRYLQFSYSANAVDVKRYEANQLVSTWGYVMATNAAYTGKRLAQVKHANLTTNVTNYLYYDDGPNSRRGLIEKIIEPNLESHTYEYYANGRTFRVTDGAGNQQSFNYNLFRNLTEFTDERGNVETYIHQDNGLLTKQIHNDRSWLEFT